MKGNLIKGAHKKSGLGKNKPVSQKTEKSNERKSTHPDRYLKASKAERAATGGHSLGKFSQVIFSSSLKTVGVILIIIVIELYVCTVVLWCVVMNHPEYIVLHSKASSLRYLQASS